MNGARRGVVSRISSAGVRPASSAACCSTTDVRTACCTAGSAADATRARRVRTNELSGRALTTATNASRTFCSVGPFIVFSTVGTVSVPDGVIGDLVGVQDAVVERVHHAGEDRDQCGDHSEREGEAVGSPHFPRRFLPRSRWSTETVGGSTVRPVVSPYRLRSMSAAMGEKTSVVSARVATWWPAPPIGQERQEEREPQEHGDQSESDQHAVGAAPVADRDSRAVGDRLQRRHVAGRGSDRPEHRAPGRAPGRTARPRRRRRR